MQRINYVKLKETVLLLSVFFTIISQLPFFRVKLGIDTQSIAYPMWIIMIFITFFPSVRIKFVEFLFPLVILTVFISAMILFEVISDKEYLASGLVLPILISYMMMIIGYLNAEILTIDLLKRLATVYVFATVVLCIDIYAEYLRGYDFNTVIYVYRSKNSAGQLIQTALVLLIFMLKQKGAKRLIKFGVILFLLYVIALMRSRASIVSLVLIPIVYVSCHNVKRRNKILVICAVTAAVLVIILNDTVYDYAIRNLILNTTDNSSISFSDLNRISSHRYSYFKTFATLFQGNELIGIGSYYMDNIYMEVILNYGIFIGSFIIALALFPLKVAYTSKIRNVDFELVIKIIALSYAFNGIFEGVAPYGPGAKCFLLWLIIGAMMNRTEFLDTARGVSELNYTGGL